MGSKQQHTTDEEDNNSDSEDADVHVSKAPKVPKKTACPKARDYDEFSKELVLAAANIYCALLASKDTFPNPSNELKLIKKAWKLVNTESRVKPLALTLSIVTIISKKFCINLFYCYFSVHLD